MKLRPGDDRPLIRSEGMPLSVLPTRPFRWLPRHGHPFCVGELVTQTTIKTLARFPVYLAALVVLVTVTAALTGAVPLS